MDLLATSDPFTAPPAAPIAPVAPLLDSDRAWLGERTVVHKIVVAMRDAHPCLADLLDELARAQGAVQSLTLRPTGDAFEAVLHARRLTPEAARRLVDRYAAHPDVGCALIEHMLVR
jgi:hypothetical protein